MSWLFLLLSVVLMVVSFQVPSPWISILALLGSFGCLGAWALMFIANRVGSVSNEGSSITMLDAEELRRMRELAESRRTTKSESKDDVDFPNY